MAFSGEWIVWTPLLCVIFVTCLLQTSCLQKSTFNRWIQQIHVVPTCLHPLLRRCGISSLTSLTFPSFLAFTIGGILPLIWRASVLADDFPRWSGGYQTCGVEAKGGRVLGELNFVTLAFVMLPVTHTSIIGKITGVSMERAIVFHRIWARLLILIMFMHGMWMWIAFGTASHEIPPPTPTTMNYIFHQRHYIKPFEYVLRMSIDGDTNWSNLSGLLAFGCFVGMGITSLPYFRRHHFELFHASHLFLALLGYIFAYFHMPAVPRFAAPAWSCYGLDLFIRLYHAYRWRGVAHITALDGGITRVEVHFEKKQLKFEAGQYAFLRIPALSWFENHPFSISSSPHDSVLTFHILSMPGKHTWTSRLHELGCVMDVEGHKGTITTCYVDGAYGIPSIPLLSYPTIVMVVGGIGVTPAASMLSYLLHTTLRSSSDNKSPSPCHTPIHTTHIHLIWVVSQSHVLDGFESLLTQASTCKHVTLHLYNTDRGKQTIIQDVHGQHIQLQPQQQTPISHDVDKQPAQQPQHDGQSLRNHIKHGRPPLSSLIASLAASHAPSSIGVMSCGPSPLIASTHDLCQQHRLAFHQETFLL